VHTRFRLREHTFANQKRDFGEVYVLECDSEAAANREAVRIGGREQSTLWTVLGGQTVMFTTVPSSENPLGDKQASKQLADALLAP
jgi:hypothetical protein